MFYEFSYLNSKWVAIESSPFSKPNQGEQSDDVSILVLNKILVFCLTWVCGGLEINRMDGVVMWPDVVQI